jgi:peptidyl-prolyl cis-trans isomerase B (cyclophilin B)
MATFWQRALFPLAAIAVSAACVVAASSTDDSKKQPAASQPAQSQPAASQPASQPAKQGPLFAVIETDKGEIRIELYHEKAPVSVANFSNLVKRSFYDGLQWHDTSRVVRVAGSPRNAANYRPGYTIKRELHPTLKFDGPGDVAMLKDRDAKDSPSHGCQFFITVKEQSRWTLDFAIFGGIVGGQDVANRLEAGDTINRIRLDGDPTPLFNRYRKQVDTWNATLDAGDKQSVDGETVGSPTLRKAP